MKIIYKYPFKVADYFSINLPRRYRILKIDKCHNNEHPNMWVEFDTFHINMLEKVNFRIFGTGHEFNNENLEYVATFFERIPDVFATMVSDYSGEHDKVMVWHVYKEK